MKSTAMMTLLALACLASFAQAEPAVIYDMGGKFDKSFNEAVGFMGQRSGVGVRR